MKSNLIGRETPELESLRRVNNLVSELAAMSFCGDAVVMCDQLTFVGKELSAEDISNGLYEVIMAVRQYVFASHYQLKEDR